MGWSRGLSNCKESSTGVNKRNGAGVNNNESDRGGSEFVGFYGTATGGAVSKRGSTSGLVFV